MGTFSVQTLCAPKARLSIFNRLKEHKEFADLKFDATVVTGRRVKILSAVYLKKKKNVVSYIFYKFTHT